MIAEIITIGDEILIGQTVDTNSAWMGAELSNAGFDVKRIISIHDRREDILNALNNSAVNCDVVLITGGLGPTSDDITKETLCDFFNTRLIVNDEVLSMIKDIIGRRNLQMNENNYKQAEVPESCRVLSNARGTAPGMWFEKDKTIFISMPGVPFEMKYIMTKHVLPELKKRFTSQVIIHRNIMTYGTFEAKLAETLTQFETNLPDNIKLAYLPSSGIIKLRLTATGTDHKSLSLLLNEHIKELYTIIPEYIYGENEESLEMLIGRILKSDKKTVCTAESCTGGEIAHLLTSIPGSSGYYNGSLIAYANSIKSQLLNVDQNTIYTYGAVSEEVVREMASGARKLFNTDFALAITGIAGPDGGSVEKPLGTVWIAVASEKGVNTITHVFGKDRISNIKRFSTAALNHLRKQVINS
jgi:competence/damage-inducible protein CinA-like protein